MTESMKVGTVFGIDDHQWRVRGIHLGAEGQESIIEIENVSHTPGWTGQWEYHPVMFVPEIILRKCKYWEVTP